MHKSFSDAEIFQVACDVRAGTAEPDSVRQLMRQFCDSVDSGESPSRYLMEYLRDALTSYLNGERKHIDVALGLRRATRGRIGVDNSHIAVEVLRARLAGMTYEDAVAEAMRLCYKERTVVQDAWKNHQTDAVFLLRNERPRDAYPWSPEECALLARIFSKNRSFFESAPELIPSLGPGKDKKSPG